MNIIEDFKNPKTMTIQARLAYLFLISALLWLTGAPMLFNHAKAAQLTSISHTIYDSNLGATGSSTISFVATNAIIPGNSIKIELDATSTTNGTFSEVGSSATSSNFALINAGNWYSIVSSCTGAGNQATVTANYNNNLDENVVFTICSSSALIASSSVVTIVVGTSTPVWTNPSTAGSYVTRISSTGPGTLTNLGDARVAILQNVVVTASVDTTFSFTVSGMATTTTVNGTTTTDGSTAVLIPFYNSSDARGALSPNKPEVASQRLNVSTNASQGFTVTVHAGNLGSPNGGALTSSAGDDIDFFKDNSRVFTATAWTAPANTLNQENTYGHFGVTSSDTTLAGGAFGANFWSGAFFSTTTREVFYNAGPSDGTTADIGSTTVGYAIQIGSLQQAGSDYQTTLTYVATPIF